MVPDASGWGFNVCMTLDLSCLELLDAAFEKVRHVTEMAHQSEVEEMCSALTQASQARELHQLMCELDK